jgi:hypothetical protein
VALACGVYVKTISRRAGAEGWRTLDLRRPRVRTAHREMIELAARAGAGEELDSLDERFRALAADRFDDENGPGEEASSSDGHLASASGALAAMWDGAITPPKPLPELPPAARAARLRAMLTGRMEEMLRRAESGRPVEGRQVAALAALAQLAEKIAPAPVSGFLPDGERELTNEEKQEKNRQAAEALRMMDDRVFELSYVIAKDMLVQSGMSEAEVERIVGKAGGREIAG